MRTAENYKKLSKEEFSRAADRYESDSAGVYRICRNDYPYILKEIRQLNFNTLLDAGCGTAPMLSLLTRVYPDKKFTGLDITPGMIERAEEKQLENTRFCTGDCEEMPFRDNTFDIIICSQCLHHLPQPQRFFNEAKRTLRPGGHLILRDMSAPKPIAWLVNKIEMPMLNLLGYGDVAIRTKDEVEAYCYEAGLNVEKLERQRNMRIHLLASKPNTKA